MKVSRIIKSRCLRADIDADSLFRKYGKEIVKEVRKALQEDILDRYDNEEYWDYELMEDIVQDYLVDKGLPVEDLIKDGTFKKILNKVAKEI